MRNLWLQQEVWKGNIKVRKVEGALNPADFMTKVLTVQEVDNRLKEMTLEFREAQVTTGMEGPSRAGEEVEVRVRGVYCLESKASGLNSRPLGFSPWHCGGASAISRDPGDLGGAVPSQSLNHMPTSLQIRYLYNRTCFEASEELHREKHVEALEVFLEGGRGSLFWMFPGWSGEVAGLVGSVLESTDEGSWKPRWTLRTFRWTSLAKLVKKCLDLFAEWLSTSTTTHYPFYTFY